MSDPGFHEVQLSRKQLVFLFMSALVIAVVIFLLGVKVGTGVRGAGAPLGTSADASAAGDTTVAAAMPPATQTTPNEVDYHERLQGRGQPGEQLKTELAKAAEPPTPAGEAVAAPPTTAPQSGANPSKPPVVAAKTPPAGAASAAAPPTKPPAATQTPAPTAWSVQVMAFKSKDLADALVGKLKSRGYSAFIFNSPTPGVPYHVRVGPFAQRDEAVRTVDKLAKEKEGYKTSVIR